MPRLFQLLILACLPLAAFSQNKESADSVTYHEFQFPLTESDVEAPFLYFNNEWICGANLDMITKEQIDAIEVKNDEYGNRSLFIKVSPETLQQLKDSVNQATKDIFINVDPYAEFPGGNGRLIEWINDNIKVPTSVKGTIRVVVGMKIMPDGTVTDTKIIRPGNNEEANREALRLANALPKFRVRYYTPRKLPIHYFLPIKFKEPGVINIR